MTKELLKKLHQTVSSVSSQLDFSSRCGGLSPDALRELAHSFELLKEYLHQQLYQRATVTAEAYPAPQYGWPTLKIQVFFDRELVEALLQPLPDGVKYQAWENAVDWRLSYWSKEAVPAGHVPEDEDITYVDSYYCGQPTYGRGFVRQELRLYKDGRLELELEKLFSEEEAGVISASLGTVEALQKQLGLVA